MIARRLRIPALALIVSACGSTSATPPPPPDAGDSGASAEANGLDAMPPSCMIPAFDFVVATDGSDAWSGTLAVPDGSGTDGPFLTLAHAQAAVRALSRTGRTTPITVLVRGGTYFLGAPWTFDASDSGSGAVPIVYQAYGCETPVVSGGFSIDSWTAGAGGVLTANVPSSASFAQLWVNDVRRYRPRALAGAYGTIDTPTATSFHYTNAAAFSPTWHNLQDVEVVVFEDWTVSRQKVLSVDSTTQTVTTTPFSAGAVATGDHGYIQGHRYLVENVEEALGPGQFYLDSTSHVLSYMPEAGETATNVHAVAPSLSQIVQVTNLSYTTFRGIAFSHSNYVIPSTGYSAGQALWDIPPAIQLVDATHVTFDGCLFQHLGNLGVDFEGVGNFVASAAEPYSNEVLNSEFSDIGVSALRLGYKNAAPYVVTEQTTTQSVHVANNVFQGGGRYMAAGMGIIVGESHDNLIEHNEISDFYQTAISVGFTFAQQGANGTTATYPSTLAHDNVIRENLIHDIGRGVTDDIGGIYLLTGMSTGNVVSSNVIHDVVNDPGTGGYGGNGIYFDQGTSNVTTQNNLVYRTAGVSFEQNEGRANILENNIFAYGKSGLLQHHFYEPPSILWATFSNNVFYYDGNKLLIDNWVCPTGADCRSSFDFHDNDDFKISGMPSFSTTTPAANYTLAQFQSMESEELGSIASDPKFVNPAYGTDNYALAAGSPAPGIGFVSFDATAAGRTSVALVPATVPAGFPLQEPADPATFY